MSKKIEGFSKFTKSEKIDWITRTHFKNAKQAKKQLESYWSLDSKLQARHEEFIENTLSNFYLPLGVAPNFLINGAVYTLPMVIEESSVVAAAANAVALAHSATRSSETTDVNVPLCSGAAVIVIAVASRRLVLPGRSIVCVVALR